MQPFTIKIIHENKCVSLALNISFFKKIFALLRLYSYNNNNNNNNNNNDNTFYLSALSIKLKDTLQDYWELCNWCGGSWSGYAALLGASEGVAGWV